MALLKTSKLIYGALATGVIGGSGGGLYYFLNSSSQITKMSDLLTKKGHKFLNFENNTDLATWKTIAKAYATSNKNKLDDLALTITGEATEQDANNLKNKRKDIINSSEYTDGNLLSAEQWCVEPITIKDLIGKSRKILDSTDSKDNDDKAWDEKVNAYLDREAQNKLPATTLTARTDNNTKADRDKLKADCKKALEKKTHDQDFHENYTPFHIWCTIPLNN